MWEPRHLTNLWVSISCYRDSVHLFTFFFTGLSNECFSWIGIHAYAGAPINPFAHSVHTPEERGPNTHRCENLWFHMLPISWSCSFRVEERGGSKRFLLSYAFRVVHMKFPAGVWVLCLIFIRPVVRKTEWSVTIEDSALHLSTESGRSEAVRHERQAAFTSRTNWHVKRLYLCLKRRKSGHVCNNGPTHKFHRSLETATNIQVDIKKGASIAYITNLITNISQIRYTVCNLLYLIRPWYLFVPNKNQSFWRGTSVIEGNLSTDLILHRGKYFFHLVVLNIHYKVKLSLCLTN
jgi:hypothetical protein